MSLAIWLLAGRVIAFYLAKKKTKDKQEILGRGGKKKVQKELIKRVRVVGFLFH